MVSFEEVFDIMYPVGEIMLPFEPEPGFQLEQRYKDAVEKIYPLAEMDGPDRPSLNRKHVFDFQDGLRLIISREKYDNGEIVLHWSASVDEKHLKEDEFADLSQFMKFVMEHMAELWGYVKVDGRVLVKSTDKGIFHFFLKENQEGEYRKGDPRLN